MQNPGYIVGIDPGKRGAIAFIKTDFSEAKVFPMPQLEDAFISLLYSYKDDVILVAIEKQQAFPKQGISSTFKLGLHYGKLLGIIKALFLPLEEIPPKRWQKFMLGNGKKKRKQSKLLSLKKAKDLFPKLAKEIGKHDGKSDALLIAEFARRTILLKD